MAALLMATRTKKAADAAATTLPDEIILILSRVPDDIVAFFRCTVACKSWRALMADPSFLRRCWPENKRHLSSLIGFFGRQLSIDGSWISGPPTCFPAPRSPLVPVCPFPKTFDPCTVSLLKNSEPLVSRQGLLLLLVYPPDHIGACLAVWDLFAGTCDIIPPPKCGLFSMKASAILLTDADYCSKERPLLSSSNNSSSFKVLVILDEYNNGNPHLSPYSFSSSESCWTRPQVSSHVIGRSTMIHSSVVVCQNKVHWFAWDTWDTCNWNLYTFELGGETIGLTKISIPLPLDKLKFGSYNPPRFKVTIDGKLSLLILHTKCLKLEIWTHQDQKDSGDGAANWMHTKVIELKPKIMHLGEVSYTCLGERTDTFIILDRRKNVYIVNLDAGTVDEVSSQLCTLKRYEVVPFEMDWYTFFMSRLEAKKK